ncbi:hypothetical protein LTR66_013959, partial [Elasticomyces elasticus]
MRSNYRYETLPSSESPALPGYDLDDSFSADRRTVGLRPPLRYSSPASVLRRWRRIWSRRQRIVTTRPRVTWPRLFIRLVLSFPLVVVFLVVATAILRPSYTRLPAHYDDLRRRALQTSLPGRANVNNERVFIAASLYDEDGRLAGGAWGRSIIDLVDLLGPENTFVSIYENDPDPKAEAALKSLGRKVACNASLVTESLPLSGYPHVLLANGESRVRRIAQLADMRNRALRPLDDPSLPRFDKLLYLNDIYFNPLDAAQLLFSTKMNVTTGRTSYRAACAVDFVNPFKFYDTFATHGLDGFGVGLPFYPWFTGAGEGTSRADVLAQKDAVRVRSCWGGMVAFEAKWFQKQPPDAQRDLLASSELSLSKNVTRRRHLSREDAAPASVPVQDPQPTSPASPLRFRAETEMYWESSECCLIHADLALPRDPAAPFVDSGIYMNPYVRTAYSQRTLSWLPLATRPERLYSWIHGALNRILKLPTGHDRRTEIPGQTVRRV